MIRTIYFPESMWDYYCGSFIDFLQKMANRRSVGQIRYGPPKKMQKYMTRMEKEMRVYRRSGNMENLINIANYAFLESCKPENKKFHFNATVESATRDEMGGALC